MQVFDTVYKVLSLLLGTGLLACLGRMVVWAIQLEPRIQSIELELHNQGAMIQQLTSTVSHLEGMMEGTRKEGGSL